MTKPYRLKNAKIQITNGIERVLNDFGIESLEIL